MKTTIKIRRFKGCDARSVSRIIRRCLREVNAESQPARIIDGLCKEFSRGKIKKRIRQFDVFVALDCKRILGTASLHLDQIMSVFVSPSLHGQGVGSRLMAHVEGIAKKRGVNKTFLSASPNAAGFYKSHGYRKIRDFYNEFGGYMTRMSKVLR